MTGTLFILTLSITYFFVLSSSPVFNKNAHSKVSWKFQFKGRMDVAKFIFEWEPSSMLENVTGVDFGVKFKNGFHSEFIPWTHKPRIRGKRYQYIIPRVPCLDTHIQLYARNNEGITYFQADDFDSVIEASSLEDIIKSSFSLSTPTNTRFEQNNENITVHWEPSQCATEYQVLFLNTDNTFIEKITKKYNVEVTELQLCGQYIITVTASIGNDKYSEEAHVGTVMTPPSVEAGDKIKPVVITNESRVIVKWDWYNTLPCIYQYNVKLCQLNENCKEATVVNVNNYYSYILFIASVNHNECQKYSIIIKPLFQDMIINEKHIEFCTYCPTID